MPKIQKAWSSRLWREIAKGLKKPTVSSIIEEFKIICRGVFPHRAGGTLVLKDGQTAFWRGLSPEERIRWAQALAGWGWLTNEHTPLEWTRESEIRIVRLGIWVWTRDMDGALPTLLAKGARERRDDLIQQQEMLALHGVWRTIGANGLTDESKLDQIDQLAEAAGDDKDIVVQWGNIENELRWKDATQPKLEKWFERHPAIPPAIRMLWLDAWKRH